MNLGGVEQECAREELVFEPCMTVPTKVGVSPGFPGGALDAGVAPCERRGIAQGQVHDCVGHSAMLGLEQKREREESPKTSADDASDRLREKRMRPDASPAEKPDDEDNEFKELSAEER